MTVCNFDNEWLRRKIDEEPDGCECEARSVTWLTCEECGWVGTSDQTGTKRLPEGIFMECPSCGAPEDSLQEIDD